MSFSVGLTSWDEIFTDEVLFASIRRQVAEFGWLWPSGETPDWGRFRLASSLPPARKPSPYQTIQPLRRSLLGMTSFSGPGMAFAASYQWARLQFWDQDEWTSSHLLLPFVAPGQSSTHGWNAITPPKAGLLHETHWSIWDGAQTSWMWHYALSEETRQQASAVIARDPWPADEDTAAAHLWFLGFFPHLGREALRRRYPAIL